MTSRIQVPACDHPTVFDVVRFHAQSRPNATAFVCGDETITFADLLDRSKRVANGLQSAGVRAGQRVAFLGKNSIEYFEVLLGTTGIGAILVPINWRLAPPEVFQVVDDCGATILFAGADLLHLLDTGQGCIYRRQTTIVLSPHELPHQVSYYSWRDAQALELASHRPSLDDVWIQLYTSGTTGRPKGVMLSHRNFRNLCGIDAAEWPNYNRWTSLDCSLLTAPIFHIGGTGWAMRGLFPGASQVIMREFRAADVVDLVGRYRVTKLALVPAAMRMLLQEPRAASADFSSLRHIYYGTSPIPPDLLSAAVERFGCGFVQGYGMTETTGAIVSLGPEEHSIPATPRMSSAGKPLPGVEVKIADENGNELPIGQIGEICTKSASNMIGYWNMPEANAKLFDAEGWLRTGDAGYLDADGYLYVKDRIKEMIISGGENIYPAEVEKALLDHPAVAEVAVIGMPSEKWGEEVKAVVVVKPGHSISRDELIHWARQRLGGYKLPKTVEFVYSLPRNSLGKVLKGELRKQYGNEQGRRGVEKETNL